MTTQEKTEPWRNKVVPYKMVQGQHLQATRGMRKQRGKKKEPPL
jgi:hypothetical protein